MNLHAIGFANLPAALILFEISRTVNSTCAAGLVLFVIGIFAARKDVANARGLDKVVALGNLLFAAPLAVFGAEHFAAAQGISQLVPSFMPWHLFWTYFVGLALVAASLSIATKIQVQWSGLGFGIMMFTFVAMMDIPGTVAKSHDLFMWTLMLRETSFGFGGWCLAGAAMSRSGAQGKGKLIVFVARIVIGAVAIFYGVEHFLRPINVPGVPLEMLMPAWIPARALISYLTGIMLLLGGAGIPAPKMARMAATYLGAWLTLIVLLIYGPILIASLMNPSTDARVEGINYFFDTMLYAGTILAVAKASAAD